ncbi:MAG: CNNM domain-containing protein [Sulfurovum sp.]|nr:CNNM domain-containing protein [Sulfurovum sp.]
MDLLVIYFLGAVIVSFVCSVLESVLLSITIPFISVLEKENPKVGKLFKWHKKNINKSIASILILNTVANTVGAAAVGVQAEHVFGSGALFWVSAVLTFAILFFGEIIPKTIGATYWKQLSPLAAYIIKFFIWLTYPIILLTLFVTNRIKKDNEGQSLSKEELLESALLSEDEGVLDEQESDIIENILKLDDIKVYNILTPRSVVFAIEHNRTIQDVIANEPDIFKYSRIPVYHDNIENVTGMILTKQLFKQALEDDSRKINDIEKDIYRINEQVPVSWALDLFIEKKEHMFLVLDKYDQMEGIVTLEDCVETILGVEIVDESDTHVDMRELAKLKMRLQRRQQKKDLNLD